MSNEVCLTLATNCNLDWNGIAAVATAVATIVAVLYPSWMMRRQRKEVADIHREVCSTAERVLAYRDAAIAIFEAGAPYLIQKQAIDRIDANTKILMEVLEELRTRPTLSDGALYTAVSAAKVGGVVHKSTQAIISGWGGIDPQYTSRVGVLKSIDEIAALAQVRANGVRRHYRLKPSGAAQRIRQFYTSLASDMQVALANQGEPPVRDWGATSF